ncbi:hypothetical protein ABK040_010075 [Willaertia magna]
MDKESNSIRECFSKYFDAVYLCVLFYTDNHVFVENSGMLPSERLKIPYSLVSKMTADSPEFQWALDLGRNWSELICEHEDVSDISYACLKTELIRATKKLKKLFNIDLGLLYDRIVIIKESRIALIISCMYFEDKSSLSVKEHYWEEKLKFEQKLYFGLGLLLSYRNDEVDRLTSSYTGYRFIEDAINYHKQMTIVKPLKEGLYLCYLRWTWNPDLGFRVLVEENTRMMIPNVQLSKGLPYKDKWEWIQSIRLREDLGRSVFKEPVNLVDLNTSIDEYEQFSQRFCRAVLELKSMLGITDLGALYDHEFIPMDSSNRVFLVVFVEQVDDEIFPDSWNRKFMWRNLKTLENTNAYTFNDVSCRLYKSFVNRIYSSGDIHSGSTQDEVSKQQGFDKFSSAIKAQKTFLPFRWISKIVHWSMKGGIPVYKLTEETENKFNITSIIQRAAKKVTGLNVELKAMITTLSLKITKNHSLAWASIGEKIENKEKRKQGARVSNGASSLFRTTVIKNNNNEEEREVIKSEPFDPNAPVKVFNLPCNIESVNEIDRFINEPSSYEYCRNITEEIVDIALQEAIDFPELSVVFNIVEELVSVVETMDLLTYTLSLTEGSEIEILRKERENYLSSFLNTYEEVTEAPELTNDDSQNSYDSVIRGMIKQFNESLENSLMLLNVASSAQEMCELTTAINEYEEILICGDTVLEKQLRNANYITKVTKLFSF